MTIRQTDTNLTFKLPKKGSDLRHYKQVYIGTIDTEGKQLLYFIRALENTYQVLDDYYNGEPRFIKLSPWAYRVRKYPSIIAILKLFDILL